ncbi:MAG: hypothetical protein J6A99_03165, partial [Clostridia bacterium]|nr:hypothetical protein [Clostridia bacterium]
ILIVLKGIIVQKIGIARTKYTTQKHAKDHCNDNCERARTRMGNNSILIHTKYNISKSTFCQYGK